MNKQQEPRLRFKGFTGAWEEKKLEDIFNTIRNAFVGTATPYYVENGHFYLESNNIKNGEINKNSQIFINDEFYYKQQDKWLKTNDLVMVQSGHVGHCAVIPEELNNVAAHALIMFSNYKSEANPYFLSYQFQTNSKINEIAKITIGNTIKHILSSDMKEFVVDFPMVEEQTQLGNFFRRLDSQIAESRAALDKIRQLKKAMLAKMFPANGEKIPKIRFKGFEGEWERKKLGEIGSTFGGLTNKSREDFGHGDARYITYMNVYQNALSSKHQLDSIEIDVKQNEVKKGDVLFTTSSETPEEVGMSSVWTFDINNVYLNSFCFGYRLNKQIDLNYLAYCLRSDYVRSQMILLAQGISRYNISKKGVMEIEILISTSEEQIQIGNFFRQLDETIALQSAEVEKLNQLKKGLLAAMLV